MLNLFLPAVIPFLHPLTTTAAPVALLSALQINHRRVSPLPLNLFDTLHLKPFGS